MLNSLYMEMNMKSLFFRQKLRIILVLFANIVVAFCKMHFYRKALPCLIKSIGKKKAVYVLNKHFSNNHRIPEKKQFPSFLDFSLPMLHSVLNLFPFPLCQLHNEVICINDKN